MEEHDPWEDLDIDDSDLPSLLRPCKRQRSPSSSSSELCIRQPPASTSCSRTIPGPAGVVLAAMIRKASDRENHNYVSSSEHPGYTNSCDNGIAVIPTQEYIRRAIEDTVEFDDDFIRSPWLSALRFVGADHDIVPSTPISCMTKRLDAGKVNQVVAVIKSCSSNGHGGLVVTLKDPTGTIGGTIHSKVLCESEYGKNLGVGAVLVLQKVAIFSPVRTAHYLNITLRNLVKVFGQCGDQSSNHNDLEYPMEYVDPDFGRCDIGRKAKTLNDLSTEERVTGEDAAEETRQGTGGKSSHDHNATRKQSLSFSSFHSNIPEELTGTNFAVSQSDNVNFGDKSANVYRSQASKTQETNDIQMSGQLLMEKSLAAQWTDEQLDQLFMGDEYDGF